MEKFEIIAATINGQKTNLVLVGTEMDYDPRDLEETFKGSLFDDVYMDPITGNVYIERYMYGNELVEYDFDSQKKIAYVGSKFVACAPECAYQKDDIPANNSVSTENDIFDNDFFDFD